MAWASSLFRKLIMFMNIREVNLFFSQTGEDILINGALNNKSPGFYVDVGAFDPIYVSNTYSFYLKGWRGINIDPNPKSIKNFEFKRPKDINLNIGISDVPGEITYYQYDAAPQFNTTSKRMAKEYGPPSRETKILTLRLEEVLDEYLPAGQDIDFLTIDVEGFDLNVLKSNNWKKYRPKVIAIEFDKNSAAIDKFLKSKKYELIANTLLTKIFRDKTNP